MAYRLGIDAGGTFTDVMAADDHGRVTVVKVPSTPLAPVDGPLNGIAAALARSGAEPADVTDIAHGTTVGVNALLQRRFPRPALITTRGFRDVLEIARHEVPGAWGSIYTWVKPPRIVPVGDVFEVDERVDARGRVLRPLADDGVRAVAAALRERDVRTVAVSLLHAYANPDHERRVREVLAAELPGVAVSLSSDVMPEFREYERALTTAVNAVLTPVVATYLAAVQRRVAEEVGPQARVWVMRSAGGVVDVEQAAFQPLRTAFSGPAAGVMGMAGLAAQAGHRAVITFDMGGTSTDVAAVHDGRPGLTTDATIDVYPLRAPTVDIVTIGAGGGSLGAVALGGRLRVGPDSAGADPGPACYGKGGTAPTVTDANLLLGRIPAAIVGGTFPLDAQAAERALAGLGERLGLSPIAAAHAVVELAVTNMAGAIREVSVKRGRDPRDYVLLAFGGAGPLHADRLMELLGLPTVLVPPAPGLGSCVGLLVADVRMDAATTLLQKAGAFDAALVARRFAELAGDVGRRLEGVPASGAPALVRSLDCHYMGGGGELTVDLPEGPVDAALLDEGVRRFHAAHRERYGFAYDDGPVEVTTLRVTGSLQRQGADGPLTFSQPPAPTARQGERRALLDPDRGAVAVPVLWRGELEAGFTRPGPVLIDQYDTTTVVGEGHVVTVDDHGNLLITRGAA